MTVSDAGVFNAPYEPKADLLRTMARQVVAARVREDAARAQVKRSSLFEYLRGKVQKIVRERLLIDLAAEGVEVRVGPTGPIEEWNGAAAAEFTIDGLDFVVWTYEGWEEESRHHRVPLAERLYLRRTCAKAGCQYPELPVLTHIFTLLDLGRALATETAEHESTHLPSDVYECTPKPVVSAGPTPAQLHEQATDRYKNIVKWRRTLEFQRPQQKALAIQRVIQSGLATSATGAEKLVETDKEYGDFCRRLTDVVIEEIAAREALVAARVLLGDRAADLPLEEDGRHA